MLANPPSAHAGGPSTGYDRPDAALASVGEQGELVHDGEVRLFMLDASDVAQSGPLPLIVSLHGARATRQAHERMTELARNGTEQGFVVVTPQATGQRPIWKLIEDGDTEFIEAPIDHVGAGMCIDTDRIFLVGTVEGPPRQAIVGAWARSNGCEPEPTVEAIPPDIDHHSFRCDPDRAVEHDVLSSGGHGWPGSPDPESASEAGSTLDATALIRQFFERRLDRA